VSSGPVLSTIVVSWKSRQETLALVRSLGREDDRELVVVDNAGEIAPEEVAGEGVQLVAPGRNLGFAAGANQGARVARGSILLFLNSDAAPMPGATESLLEGFAKHPEAAGLAPRLVGPDGAVQYRWQLRPLPSAVALLAHALFWDPVRGPEAEPPPATVVEQPAAAALALRRSSFDAVGGFDEGFFPAWFEDVDLARRLAERGERILYWPAAQIRHGRGGSLATLGYGGFLRAYDRNLARYLRLHHGAAWALAFRLLVPVGAALRIAALPLRKPARAASRRSAAGALLGAAAAALGGWKPQREAP